MKKLPGVTISVGYSPKGLPAVRFNFGGHEPIIMSPQVAHIFAVRVLRMLAVDDINIVNRSIIKSEPKS